MGDHQAPPVARVVAQVRDARQATPHLEHNPFSRLGICHAIPLRKLNDPAIEPFITDTIVAGTRVYTDEYSIYARLQSWGYGHKSVNHGRGEFARDEDGDGFCEVHVNTMEGFWSLLRSWLRPHRGISQEKLPLYLGLFEFVHNVRKRGKALLGALIELLVS
jgi:transposase